MCSTRTSRMLQVRGATETHTAAARDMQQLRCCVCHGGISAEPTVWSVLEAAGGAKLSRQLYTHHLICWCGHAVR